MTQALEKAFGEAAKRSEAEQDVLASWLLAELAAENAFDRRIDQTASRLTGLAQQALDEDEAGTTRELNAEQE